MFELQFMIENWTPDVLTLATTFYDVSFPRPVAVKAFEPSLRDRMELSGHVSGGEISIDGGKWLK